MKAIHDTLIIAGAGMPLGGLFGILVGYLVTRRRFPGRRAMEMVSMINYALPGTIVGIGGHVHAYAQSIEFSNATTGEVIYRATPQTDAAGQIVGVPIERLYRWSRLGVHIEPTHRYRVTVFYDNPSKDTIPSGGMGVVAGVFLPAAAWPATDTTNQLYVLDRKHYLREVSGKLSEILAEQGPRPVTQKVSGKR